GNRIAAVLHRLGFTVRTGDRSGIQMIAADHDRRLEFAVAHHLVEREAELVALAETDPADARRQALEADALFGHVEPVVQVWIVRNELFYLFVGFINVL